MLPEFEDWEYSRAARIRCSVMSAQFLRESGVVSTVDFLWDQIVQESLRQAYQREVTDAWLKWMEEDLETYGVFSNRTTVEGLIR